MSKTFTANGTDFLNLTGLSDGALTTSVTATDTSGNVANVAGPALTLDTSTGLNVVTQTAQNYDGTGAADLIEVQASAEGSTFSRNEFNALLELADKGIAELVAAQQSATA